MSGVGTVRAETLDGSSRPIASVLETGGDRGLKVALAEAGVVPHKLISAATTNGTVVKNTPGVLYGVDATNTHATSPRYLKIYDKATVPTVGTDVPKLTYLLPPSNGGHSPNIPPHGIAFANGIGIALTTGAADNDSGAVGAGEIVVNTLYR